MTRELFTADEQAQLQCNPNVQAVSDKSIMYTDEFKRDIKSYMIYYNHYRGPWNSKKLPPAIYRQQLLQVA